MSYVLAESEREKRAAAEAIDLLENPAWEAVIRDATREAHAARAVIFGGVKFETADQMGLAVARAQGSLAALQNVVLEVYRRANKEVPTHVSTLFQ